jgi:hypothetical protein
MFQSYHLVLTAAALFFVGQPLAMAQPAAPHQQLQKLNWLIGNWQWQWETDQDVPDIAQRNQKISGEMRCRWDLDGHAIDMRLTLTVADRKVWSAHTMIGWDPAGQQLITRSFDSRGGHGSGMFQRQQEAWLLRTSSVNADGNELINALLFSDIQQDSFSLQGTNRPAGSDAVFFGPKKTVQRKPDEN